LHNHLGGIKQSEIELRNCLHFQTLARAARITTSARAQLSAFEDASLDAVNAAEIPAK
jgi:hypothetical protein